MMSNIIEQVDEEIILDFDLISKLLRMKQACENWTNDQMCDHLKKYGLDVSYKHGELSRLKNSVDKSTMEAHDKSCWKKFQDTESLELKFVLDGNIGFGGKPYKVNFNTATEWIHESENSVRCIFLNTYIDIKDWHNPNIQMHLSLQKSIEQKSNLVSIHGCHSLSRSKMKERVPKIQFCTENPPSYKHYRILFLPLTTKRFNDCIEAKDAFYDNLRFSTFQHSALSIQLAVLTADDLMAFMNDSKHKTFFQDTESLGVLGLNKEFASYLKSNAFAPDKIDELINCITVKSIPTKETETGMDFMLIQREYNKTTDKDLWGAFYNARKNGLNYFVCGNKENIKVRREFTQKLFDYITFEGEPITQQTDFSEVDPLFEFNKNRNQKLIRTIFHPLLRKH